LASKDIARFHLDFNATQLLIGRADAPGFDQNRQINLAFSHPLRHSFQFTGELDGDTQLNQHNPGFASSLWALTYGISPRLVLDVGTELGLTAGGPRRKVFAGATYAIGKLHKKSAIPSRTP
jgi:hypothetical protein